MANQWYIRRGSNVLGPSTSAQLKSDVAEGLVKRDDDIGKSPDGPWTVARKVKGLFPSEEASAIRDEPAGQESISLKPCPFCAEKIQAAAIKCKHCGEFQNKPQLINAAKHKHQMKSQEFQGMGENPAITGCCPKCGKSEWRSHLGFILFTLASISFGILTPLFYLLRRRWECISCHYSYKSRDRPLGFSGSMFSL